jgi:hypothetical protein
VLETPHLNLIYCRLSDAWLMLFGAALCVISSTLAAQAQQTLTVQPIVICQTPSNGVPSVTTTPGTGCAPINSLANPTGTPGSATNPIGFYDTTSKTDITWAIWHQANITIAWVLPVLYYNNSAFQSITDIVCLTPPPALQPNPNCTTPYVLRSQNLLTLTQQPGISQVATPQPPLYPNARVLNMFFGNSLTPPAGLVGKLFALGWLGSNGIYVSASAFSSGRAVTPCFDCLAHEIGHNLGADHADIYNYNMQAPALDLMTAGASRTVPTSTSNALSQLGTGDGAGKADQLSATNTPNYPGTAFQQTEASTSGFLNPTPLAQTTVIDPPGSDLITFSTTGASYNNNAPPGWPANVTLVGLTVTLSPGVTFDPVNPVKFTKNTAYPKYFSSFSYNQGNASNPNCSSANTQCLAITLKGLPASAGSLIFTNGILLSAPPPPPGSNLLDQMVARGVYMTYKFSDGSIISGKLTGSAASGVMTDSQQLSTSAIPASIDPPTFNAFMKTVTNPPAACSKGVDPNVVPPDQRLSNGCPPPTLRDGDPRLEAGQSGDSRIASCTPAGSLSVLLNAPSVTAYVPNGAWSAGFTGIRVVPIEPAGGTPATISTGYDTINSCSSNTTTGLTVCTANNSHVYLVSGTSLATSTPLTTSANGTANFSGGSCQNCGVAINQLTNEAVITMGLAGSPSGSGLQFLNLANNQFTIPPVNAVNQVSEAVLWDPGRNLILSPNEGKFVSEGPDGNGVYDLFDTSSMAATPELSNPAYTLLGVGRAVLDSAAEDCSTGVALATNEFTNTLYFADLSQKTNPTPTTWAAPQQFLFFPEFNFRSAGTSGIAVAPGSHLAVVTDEFGGNQIGVVKLPMTTVSGTAPGVDDYVAAQLPNTPDEQTWLQGLDPHTVTAYVSPNDNKSYAVMANIQGALCEDGSLCTISGPPKWVAVVDMAALLAAPRASPHNVFQCDLYEGEGCVDLVGSGIVRYIATGN